MNIPVIFQFLKDLSANNNREWFNEHKAEYELARAEFDNFLATVIARISLFDETIRGIQPKDCTYRIYRDTRFSADKTPYKIHFGGYINAKGKKSNHCGYYVHLQPNGSMLAGGSLCLPSGSKFCVAVTPEAYRKGNFPCLQICSPDSADFGRYKALRRCGHEFLPDTPLRSRLLLFLPHEQLPEVTAYPHIPAQE